MAGIQNNIIYGNGFKLQPSSATDISNMSQLSTDISNVNYTGNPEGVITANPSSFVRDPVSGIAYIKSTGTGDTGWSAISDAASDPGAPHLPLAGGTLSGTLILNGNPINPNDAANKAYVDTVVAGGSYKTAAYAASTATLNATYSNGAAGVGATLTNAGSLVAFAIDGVSPPINSRILVKNQSSTAQNGIYTLTTVGSGAVAWILTRATDYDQSSEIAPGNLIPVTNGTINATTVWLETATVTTIGTDPIVFQLFQSAPIATTQYDVLVGGTNNTIGSVGPGSAGQVLQSGGASANPAYSTAIYPATTTINQLLYSSANNNVAGLAVGSDGQVLTLASGAPTWATPTTGTVTSVSGTANRITSTGGATPVIDISASYVGQSSITTLGTLTTGVWNATTITETHGGTNQSSYATGDILYASGVNTLAKLAASTDGKVLTLASGIPSWATPAAGTVTSVSGTANRITSTGGATPVIDISASYVGQSSITTLGTLTAGVWNATTITETHGGTNQSSYAIGDILYASGVNTLAKLVASTDGKVLTLASGIPSWQTPAAGTVTSVSGTTNRITSTGGATPVIDISGSYIGQSSITTLGTVTTGVWNATTITETHGGTNQSSYATGDILYASGANTLAKLAAGSDGKVLTLASGIPSWATPAGGTVTSVSGTLNRITSSGGATPVIDISASYVGQSSITTLGTVTTGVWNGSTVDVSHGGTGNTTFTAYSLIAAGTTATGAFQNVSGVGTSGQLLTSNGPSALPTWQTPASSGSPTGALQYLSTSGGTSFSGWLPCDGAVYTQATYTALYAQIGLLNPGGSHWTVATQKTSSNLVACAANTHYAAAGNLGALVTSTDGLTWASNFSGTTSSIFAMAYLNTTYVLGGTNGYIATSTDATTWKTRWPNCSVAGNSTASMIFSSIYVTTGPNGLLYTSTDGAQWQQRNSGTTSTVNALVFGGSKYVYGGSGGLIATSTDAITWTQQYTGSTTSITCLSYGNSVYTYIDAGGSYYSSTDAVTWTKRVTGGGGTFGAMAFGASVFAGSIGNAGGMRSSTDGTTWTSRTSNTASVIQAMTFGTIFVYGTQGGGVGTSTDGITWTARTSGTSSNINALAYGTVYVYGTNGGGISSSTDGITWTARTSNTTSSIYSMTYNSGNFYAVGNSFVLTSTDGITWTKVASPSAQIVSGLAYGASTYVMGNQAGGIFSSTDLITWTSRTSNTTSQINSLIFANSLFVYATNGGGIASSTDGITWTARTSLTTSSIMALTYTTNYVYGGANGVMGTSTDAITWTAVTTSPTTTTITGLAYSNSIIALSNQAGEIFTSTNLSTWTSQASYATDSINALAVGTKFIAAGNAGYVSTASTDYGYNTGTQFQVPTDAQLGITIENTTNFKRGLYIKT